MAQVTRETLEHLKRWEGLRLEAYPDPGSRNGEPWTIGYGHTSDSFMRVYRGQVISRDQAEKALLHDAKEAAQLITSLVQVPLSDSQLGVLISFVFNIGGTAFRNSTLLRKLNLRDYDAVPSELARWNRNDGRVMPGLTARRKAEAILWSTPTVHVAPAPTGFWAWLLNLLKGNR